MAEYNPNITKLLTSDIIEKLEEELSRRAEIKIGHIAKKIFNEKIEEFFENIEKTLPSEKFTIIFSPTNNEIYLTYDNRIVYKENIIPINIIKQGCVECSLVFTIDRLLQLHEKTNERYNPGIVGGVRLGFSFEIWDTVRKCINKLEKEKNLTCECMIGPDIVCRCYPKGTEMEESLFL